MAIGDELQHAVYTCNILSMQDDRIILYYHKCNNLTKTKGNFSLEISFVLA